MPISWSRRIRQTMASFLDLPKDAVLDLPRVVLIGDVQLFVENHKGILEFNDHQLRLALAEGELIIAGKELVVSSIDAREIWLEGKIRTVQYG